MRKMKYFVSSTFQDMLEERHTLHRLVFPILQETFGPLGVFVSHVDLKWGITQEEAEAGGAIARCLEAIDECRPFFIGVIGQRYGWVPQPGEVSRVVLDRYPWIKPLLGEVSVTELEIRHGWLNASERNDSVFFLKRGRPTGHPFDFPRAGDTDPSVRRRLSNLVNEIRGSGATIIEYDHPGDFSSIAQRTLTDLIRRRADVATSGSPTVQRGPRESEPAPLSTLPHDAAPQLFAALRSGHMRIAVTGPTGIGKSEVLACAHRFYKEIGGVTACIAYEFGTRGAETELAEIASGVETVAAKLFGPDFELDDGLALMDGKSFAACTAIIDKECGRRGYRLLFLIDALDRLEPANRLSWLPQQDLRFIQLVIGIRSQFETSPSLLSGWTTIEIDGIGIDRCKTLVCRYLERQNKHLSDAHMEQLLACSQISNPLFLTLVLRELCVAASFSSFDDDLTRLTSATSLEQLYGQILQRIRRNFRGDEFRDFLCSVLISRRGLNARELMDLCGISASTLGAINIALEGLVIWAEDCPLRLPNSSVEGAVRALYLASAESIREMHVWHADWHARETAPQHAAEARWHLEKAERCEV